MTVYIVTMLVPDDREDNTQTSGVFATRAAAEQFVSTESADGLEFEVEEWVVQQ